MPFSLQYPEKGPRRLRCGTWLTPGNMYGVSILIAGVLGGSIDKEAAAAWMFNSCAISSPLDRHG